MRLEMSVLAILVSASNVFGQAQGKFPPDSLLNVKVIPRSTPVSQVIGSMRNYTAALGVRCQYCHVGEEGQPLERFDFASDEKRNKLVAREMMQMLAEINRRLENIPQGDAPAVSVTCATCHRGVTRPVPLSTLVQDVALSAGADSAIRAYRNLRSRHYGSGAYDFREPTLNIAAFQTARAGKPDDGLALLRVNEELFPNSSGMYVFRGNVLLIKGDTTGAADAFRHAIRLDSTNAEARGRLRTINR